MPTKFYSPGYPAGITGQADPVNPGSQELHSGAQKAVLNWAATSLAIKWRYRTRLQHQALRRHHKISFICTEMATSSELVLITNVCSLPPQERKPQDLGTIYMQLVQWERAHGGRFFTGLEAVTGPKAVQFTRLRAFGAGTTLWNQGDAADDTFYFILTGAVDVIIDGQVKDINGGHGLGVSTSFGEKALLPEEDGAKGDFSHVERTAGIRTKTDVICITLTRIDYLTVTGDLPSQLVLVLCARPEDRSGFGLRLLEQYFDAIMAGSHAVSFTKRLSRACTYRRLRSNEQLFKEGDVADAFYIVISGYVQVVVAGKAIGCLGPGEAFGEAGLNLEDPDAPVGIRSAGITAGFQIGLPGAPTFDEVQRMMIQEKMADGGAANLLKKNRKKNKENKNKTGANSATTVLAMVTRDAFKRLVAGTEQKLKLALASRSETRSAEEIELLIDLLRSTPFFDVIASPVMQKKCCRCLQLHESEPGEYLFKTGDPGDLFFIMVHGTVRGELPNGKTFVLQAGSSFGELAVLGNTDEERQRSCAMVCTERCIFATLARPDYLRLVGSLPDQAVQVLCKRPDNRTQDDLNVLQIFFADSEFFKDLHFLYLQMIVAERMTVRGVKAPNFLFEQGEETDGHLYFLLAGRLQPIINGQKAVTQYEPVKVFWDSGVDGSPSPPTEEDETASTPSSSKRPTPVVDENDVNLRCSLSIHAIMPDKRDAGAKVLTVTGFPVDWAGAELYDVFKQYGDISSIRLLDEEKPVKDQFGHMVYIKKATVTFADSQSGQRAIKDRIMVDTAKGRQARLLVQVAADANSGNKVLKSHEIKFREIRRNEVIVSHLSKKDYDEFVVGALKDLVNILMSEPRSRTIKQLALLATFFSETKIMSRVKRYKMLGRNICRFLGCQSFTAGTRIYRRGLVGDRVYVVLKGAVLLRKTILASAATGDQAPVVFLRGSELGVEILENRGEKRYEMVCTAATDVIMAVLMKEDYLRIVNMEPMQAAIDQLWQLGIDNNGYARGKSGHQQDDAEEEEKQEGQRAEAKQPQEESDTMLYFTGYKAVYQRIVKTIAENHLSKKSDQEAALQDDWRNDLEIYGDPDQEALTHEQYSDSLYQLVDEWCGGVEYTEMYIKMLQLIVQNSTEEDADGKLILTPVKKQKSRYQQLMDSRALYQRYQQQFLVKTKIGKPDIGDAPHSAEDAWGDILKASHLSHASDDLLNVIEQEDEDDDHNIEHYRQMFDSIDVDGSGELDKEELAKLCDAMGRNLNQEELDLAMSEMDQDGGGTICFDEFSKWYRKLVEGDALLREVFQSVDIDGSGSLDRGELQEVLFQLGRSPSEEELDKAMASMDSDGGGDVDFDEFRDWFNVWSAKQELLERQAAFQRLTQFDASKAKQIFEMIDEDGSGELDRLELAELCNQLGREMSEEELEAAMQEMDHDGGGTVCFEEFSVWFKELAEGDNLLREVFDAVDMDGGGVLDRDEVAEVMVQLGQNISEPQIDEIMSQMDSDGSGEVEFGEFAEWFNLWRSQNKLEEGDNTADIVRPHSRERLASFTVHSSESDVGVGLSDSARATVSELPAVQEGPSEEEDGQGEREEAESRQKISRRENRENDRIPAERKTVKLEKSQLHTQKQEQQNAEKILQKQHNREQCQTEEQNLRHAEEQMERKKQQEQRAETLAAQQMQQQIHRTVKQCTCSSCELGEPCAVQRGRDRRAVAELVVDPFPALTKHLEQYPGWKIIYSATKIQASWRRVVCLYRSVQLRASQHYHGLTSAEGAANFYLGIDAKLLSEIMARSGRELTAKECESAIAWCNHEGFMMFEQFRDWTDWLAWNDEKVRNAFSTELRNFQLESSNLSEDDDDFMLSTKARESIRNTQQRLVNLESDRTDNREAEAKLMQRLHDIPVPVELIPAIAKRLASECLGASGQATHTDMLTTEIKALVDSFMFRVEKMKTLRYVQEWWSVTVLPQLGQLPRTKRTTSKWWFAWRVMATLELLYNEALEKKATTKACRKVTRRGGVVVDRRRGRISESRPRKAPTIDQKQKPPGVTEAALQDWEQSGSLKSSPGRRFTSSRKSSHSEQEEVMKKDENELRGSAMSLAAMSPLPPPWQQNEENDDIQQPKTPVQLERNEAEGAFSESPYQLASSESISSRSYLNSGATGEIPRLSHNELINKYLTLVDPAADTEVTVPTSKPKGVKSTMRAVRANSGGGSSELRPWTGETPFETTAEVAQGYKNSRQRLINTGGNFSSLTATSSGGGGVCEELSSTHDSMGSYISTPGLSRERGFSANAERHLDPAFGLSPQKQQQKNTGSEAYQYFTKHTQVTATTMATTEATRLREYGLVDSATPRQITTAEAQARLRVRQRAEDSNSRLARRTATNKSTKVAVQILESTPSPELTDPAAITAGPGKMPSRPLLLSPAGHKQQQQQKQQKGTRSLASMVRIRTQPQTLQDSEAHSSSTIVGTLAGDIQPSPPVPAAPSPFSPKVRSRIKAKTAFELHADALALETSREARAIAKAARKVAKQPKETRSCQTTNKQKRESRWMSEETDLMLLHQLRRERDTWAQMSSLRAGRASVDLPRRQGYNQNPKSTVALESLALIASDSEYDGNGDGVAIANSEGYRSADKALSNNPGAAQFNTSMPNLQSNDGIQVSTSLPAILHAQRRWGKRNQLSGGEGGGATKKQPTWNIQQRRRRPSTLTTTGSSAAPGRAWTLAEINVFTQEPATRRPPRAMGQRALVELARYQLAGTVCSPNSQTRSFPMYRMPV